MAYLGRNSSMERSRVWLAAAAVAILGALLLGWFVPNDRYDILTALLVGVAIVLWALFSWGLRLQRQVDANTAARQEAADMALAFHDSEWDYARGDWITQ